MRKKPKEPKPKTCFNVVMEGGNSITLQAARFDLSENGLMLFDERNNFKAFFRNPQYFARIEVV